jgi:hypothetical protein
VRYSFSKNGWSLKEGGMGSKKSAKKNETPHCGLKEHASVNVESEFVLATTMTPASVHDTHCLLYLTLASCHTGEQSRRCMQVRDIMGSLIDRLFISMRLKMASGS